MIGKSIIGTNTYVRTYDGERNDEEIVYSSTERKRERKREVEKEEGKRFFGYTINPTRHELQGNP